MRCRADAGSCRIAGFKWILLLVAMLALTACTVPYMQVDPALSSSAEAMPVAGRQGWLINQQLQFGEFQSGPVKRSWTTGYNIPFVVRFSGAKEKLGFSVRNSSGETAELFCLGKLREIDLPVFNKAFEVNLNTTDVFTCAITLSGDSFEFYSENLNQNPNNNHGFDEITGQLQGPGLDIALRPVGKLEGGQTSWSTNALGYELQQDGKTIAAVETLNNGRVWINPELSASQKLLVAGVASALLLRSSLAEHNDDLL
jgi:hypothetical protein